MTIYNVYHKYDTDGGFGDAIPVDELVASFANGDDATEFVNKYSNPHIYNRPYNDLYCGELIICPTEIIEHSEFDINKTPEEYGVWFPMS